MFTKLQELMPEIIFNPASRDKHVPKIEQYIRTVKECIRCGYNAIPYRCIPRIMLIRLVMTAVFYLNLEPCTIGPHNAISPRYKLTGRNLSYKKHIRTKFCLYVHTHEEHSNLLIPQTQGAFCMGPSGNDQGGYSFFLLSTGRVIK